jgi:pectin methylesterase-like acyl-CoA thioesterase
MKKTGITISLILLLITSNIILFLPAEAESKTINVPDDYASIQEALDNAEEGATVFVKKGVYVENPVVNKSISLVGEDRDSTVIDVTAGLKVQSNNVTINRIHHI